MDDAFERLMNRVLDGEATPIEAADFQTQIARDSAARALYDDYVRIDGEARTALRSILVQPVSKAPATASKVIPFPHRTWLAAAAGVLAAAAAIGFVVSPAWHSVTPRRSGWPDVSIARNTPRPNSGPTYVADEGLSGRKAWQQIAPRRSVVDVRRDWIGVLDPKTQQIYLLGLDRRNDRSVPVRYEH